MRLRRKDYRYITLDKIGDVNFKRSDRAKRVSITVKSVNLISVTVPQFITFKKAESFVLAKTDWILKQKGIVGGKIDITSQIDSISNEQKKQLEQRVQELSEKHNFKISRLTIKRMKTRGGSCSAKNCISLNIGLVALPKELQDYVILHELVHTKIKDHGDNYWKVLSSVIPDAKTLNRKLNKYYRL